MHYLCNLSQGFLCDPDILFPNFPNKYSSTVELEIPASKITARKKTVGKQMLLSH